MRTMPVLFLIAVIAVCVLGATTRADALAKLQADKLEAVHQAVLALRPDCRKLDRSGPYLNFRANLHVHPAFSHDSRGSIDEIVTAARAVGPRVLLFTEPPADHYDFYKDGHR